MRGLFAICSFLLVGVVTAFYIGFGFERLEQPLAIDDELEGLNEKHVIRFSHVVARDTPKGRAAAYFAELVKEKTNGWVEVQLYPNGVLYQAQEEFEALREGEIDMIAPALSEITLHDPKWVVMDLPYVFTSEEMVKKAFEGRVGELLFESIEKKGFKGLAFWDNGFKQITNNVRPIHLPEDIRGLKIRVMPSEVLYQTYYTLQATGYASPFNDVYRLLQNQTIDGQENTLSNIFSKGFYLQQTDMTISNHNYLGYAVLVNPEFWDRLPTVYQKSIEDAMEEVTAWLRQHSKEMNEKALSNLYESESMRIYHLSADEQMKWLQALDSVYDRYEPIIGKEIMQEIRQLQN